MLREIYTTITDGKIHLYMFYAFDCPRCSRAHAEMETLKKKYPDLIISQYEVKRNPDNREFLRKISDQYGFKPKGYPVFFIGKESRTGFFTTNTTEWIETEIRRIKGSPGSTDSAGRLNVPIIGDIDPDTISLPFFTIYIGLLDGFNPCALWVLVFLLGLLAHSKERRKLILIGSIFVAASGLVYFAFMTAWINLFIIIGYSALITRILAALAMIMGLVNIKDFFFFKRGVSLTIPESAKPKLYKRVRNLLLEKKTFAAVTGTVILAVFVNFIELGCTIGFPAIYTRILSLRGLDTLSVYLYMALYNIAYVIPLIVVVALFALTLSRFKFTETHGRILKLIGGAVMLILGIILLAAPQIL
jgi:cytochrome c biogenesis protein CcdA